MADEDEPSQVSRALGEKYRAQHEQFLDGGAVAVGLLLTVGMFSPTFLFPLPAWLIVSTVASGLFLGGYLTGYICSTSAVCPACHGGVVGLAFVGLVTVLAIVTAFAAGQPGDVAIVEYVRDDRLLVTTALLGAVGIPTIGSALGTLSEY